MIPDWNGVTGREVVLDLLAYTSIGPFEGKLSGGSRTTRMLMIYTELYTLLFEPLEEAILDGTTESKLALIAFYKNLLDQWTVMLLARTQPPATTVSAITSLVDHTNILALTIIQSSLTVTTLSVVLSFYECTASLISQPALKSSVRITIPPAELIYSLHFTQSVSTLSRLCAILALYKRAFEIAMAPKLANSLALDQQSYPKDYVNHFNGFLMDICNCVWRSRAFNTSDLNALGCLLPAPIVPVLTKYVSGLNSSLSLPTLFSLSFSPVYCLLAISYVREVEDRTEEEIETRHPGPPTQTSLKQLEKDGGLKLSWADYRLGVLHYLENKGVPGVGELMYNTMKHLMSARENRAPV
jgi:centromere protein I